MECMLFDHHPWEMKFKAEESSPDSHTDTWVNDGRDFPSSPWYDSNDYMLDSSPRNYYGGVSNLPLQHISRSNSGHAYSQPYPAQDSPLSCLFRPYFNDVAVLPGNNNNNNNDLSALQQCPDLGFPAEFAPAGHDVSPPDKLAASAAGARTIGDHQDITPPPPVAAAAAAAAAPVPGLTNNPSTMDASHNGFAIDGLPRVLPDLDPELFQVQSCFAAPYTAAPANQYTFETPPGYPIAESRGGNTSSLHSPFPDAELPPLPAPQARDCSTSIAWRGVIMQQQQQQHHQQARGPMLPNLRDLAPPSQPAWSSSPWQIYYADSSSESGGDDNAFGEPMELDDIPSPPQQRAPPLPVAPQPRKPLPEGRTDRIYTPVVPILPSNAKASAPPPGHKTAGSRRPLPSKSRASNADKKNAHPRANDGDGDGDSDSDAPLQNKFLLRRKKKPAAGPVIQPPRSSPEAIEPSKPPHSHGDDGGTIEPVDLSSGSKRERDAFLLRCRGAGMSYREIKAAGNFAEAESTLRGRHRNLTKAVKDRVRKPVWLPEDDRLLEKAFPMHTSRRSGAVPWAEISAWMSRNGASYRFAAHTCSRRWEHLGDRDRKGPAHDRSAPHKGEDDANAHE